MFYISDFCHLCLKDDKCLIDLSEKLPENRVITTKLGACVSEVEWSTSRNLLICRLCLQKLDVAYDFKQTCIKSVGILKTQLNQLKAKEEPNTKRVKAKLHVLLSKNTIGNDLIQKYIKSQDNTNKYGTLSQILDQSLVYAPTTSFIIANGQPISYQNIFLNFVATNNIPGTQTTQPVLLNVTNQAGLPENDAILKHLLETKKPEEVSVEIDPSMYFGHFLAATTPAAAANIECKTCCMSYTTIKLLRRHFNEVHNGNLPYECTFCFSKFLLQDHFDKHMKNHMDADTLAGSTVNLDNLSKFGQTRVRGNILPGDFKCDQCMKVCLSLVKLEKHIIDIHNSHKQKTDLIKHVIPLTCNVCKLEFSTEVDLQQHTKSHTDKKSKGMKNKKEISNKSDKDNVDESICDINNHESKASVAENSVVEAIVNGPNPVDNDKKVESCAKDDDLNIEATSAENNNLEVGSELNDNGNTSDITLSDAAFNEFIIESPDGKPICSFCKKIFSRRHDLRRHINNVHVRSMQYKCHLCGEAFYEGFRLTRHLRCHYSSLSCSECRRIFSSLPETTTHMLTTHNQLKNIECNVCYLSFNDVNQLKLHMDMHMMEIVYKCHLCKEEFGECRDLTKHVSEHNGMKTCENCNRMFYKEDEFLVHKEACMVGHYKCDVCPRVFKKKRYLHSHIRAKHAVEMCVDEAPQKKKQKLDDI